MQVVDKENSSTRRSKDLAILRSEELELELEVVNSCRLRNLSELVACCNGGNALRFSLFISSFSSSLASL